MNRQKFFFFQVMFLVSAYVAVFFLHYALLQLTLFPFVPTLLQIALFLGCYLLFNRPFSWWMISFIYWLSLCLLGQSLADTNGFMGIIPYTMSIPLLFIILWGVYKILSQELRKITRLLQVDTILGRNTFLLATLVLFFGYFGAAGFLTKNPPSILMSWLSWMLVPLSLHLFYKRLL